MAEKNIRLKSVDQDALFPQTKVCNLIDAEFTDYGNDSGDILVFLANQSDPNGGDWKIQKGYGYKSTDNIYHPFDLRYIVNNHTTGSAGQVLTKIGNGAEWRDLPTFSTLKPGTLLIVGDNGQIQSITIDELKKLLK